MPTEPSEVEPWLNAIESEEVDSALRRIHAHVADATRAARPLCLASGRCCDFAAFGHRLFVTGLETAWCLKRIGRTPATTRLAVADATQRGTCPFLRERICSVHEFRPFACRTFFCDRDATEWQRDLHERCHAEMRAIHERHHIPYRYGEWREMLALFMPADSSRDGS